MNPAHSVDHQMIKSIKRILFCLYLITTFTIFGSSSVAQNSGFLQIWQNAFPNLSFDKPVTFRHDPSNENWLFIVEQTGRVWTFENDFQTSEKYLMMDLSDLILGPDVDVESGLLSIALHPNFDNQSYIFAYYLTGQTGQMTARVSRFPARGTPAVVDIDSEVVLIELERGDLKHNGGDMHFASDGMLFVSFGDGFCCGDPANYGQDPTNLFSTIIRIDVDNPQPPLQYGIPEDNPFVGHFLDWREEVWAYGLRNPWRFSIHPETGEIWLGDVGELTYEEINRVVPGGNYGWSTMEGPDCLEWPPGTPTECEETGILPAWYYGRDVGVSVTGGYFYRGNRRPDWHGKYVFADWSYRKFFLATVDDSAESIISVEILYEGAPGDPHPSAYGEDASGELYMLDYFGGRIFTFREREYESNSESAPQSAIVEFELGGPNPFRNQSKLTIRTSGVIQSATVELLDVLGRRVAVPLDGEPLAEGVHHVQLESSGLAAGVYVARLLVNGAPVDSVPLTVVR